MSTHLLFDQKMPTREQIDAAIRRAHEERSQAFRSILAAFFSARKAPQEKPAERAGPYVAGCA